MLMVIVVVARLCLLVFVRMTGWGWVGTAVAGTDLKLTVT